MLTMEKVLFLKSVPLFSGLKLNELAHIAEIAEELERPKDDVLFNENEPGDCLFIIVEGMVKVLKKQGNRERVITILGERETVGEMAIFDNESRSATVQLAEDSLLLKITSEEFRELVYDYPEIAFGVFRVFSRRLREARAESEESQAPKASPGINLQ